MKVAIISDTHDNITNFNKIIGFLNKEKIMVLLHCGDICNEETIQEAEKNFNGEIEFARGNGDYHLEKVPDTLELDLDNKKVAVVHYPDLAKKLAESGKYDLVFYGHTHRPWEETIGKCRLVNPGELAGQRYKPCFAIYDTQTDKLELKILEKL
ncbi:MAG: metallophosphoesterase family protein [bacterium]|nr:metallophosphoesterase family protein [bacterium]